MGTPLPLPTKGGGALQIFCPCLLWPNVWLDQDGTWHGGRPQPRRPCGVRWGHSSPPQKGAQLPKFSAHVYCGQTAGWIKMVLVMEVGLSPGDFVLDGDPALPQKGGGAPPQFSAHVYCGQTAGWIKMPLGVEVPRPGQHCVRCGVADPAPPPRGAASKFRPTSVVAKRLDGSRCHLVRR